MHITDILKLNKINKIIITVLTRTAPEDLRSDCEVFESAAILIYVKKQNCYGEFYLEWIAFYIFLAESILVVTLGILHEVFVPFRATNHVSVLK